MESLETKVKPGGWDRDQLTLRLSPTRRAQLMALAGEAPALTPQQAIDRAIAVAHEAQRMDAVAATVDGRLAQWATPPPFGDWLRAELVRHGTESASSAVVRGIWKRSERLEPGAVVHDFNCQLLAVDGQRVETSQQAAPDRIRLGPIQLEVGKWILMGEADACLWCEPSEDGTLRVVVHAFLPDGGVGPALREHRF